MKRKVLFFLLSMALSLPMMAQAQNRVPTNKFSTTQKQRSADLKALGEKLQRLAVFSQAKSVVPKPIVTSGALPVRKASGATRNPHFATKDASNFNAIPRVSKRNPKSVNNDDPIPDGQARIIFEAWDEWGDGSGYQLLIGDEAMMDSEDFPELYSYATYTIPEDANYDEYGNSNFILDEIATIDIPAGKYGYAITNPTPDVKTYLVGMDTYEFKAGHEYDITFYFDFSTFSEIIEITDLTLAVPTNVTVSNVTTHSADVAWTANGKEGQWNLRYRAKGGNGDLFDFEDGAPDDWYIIDNDDDGIYWQYANFDGNNCHSGTGCMTSASWTSDDGALEPDNWLLTNLREIPNTLTFWANGQDASWAEEHFAVYFITEDFDNIWEVLGETEATGVPTEYTVDLSDFEGEIGYIAFRHFNCTDMFRLNIDDVEFGESAEWIVVENVTDIPYTLAGLDPETTYEVQVQGVIGDESSDWSGSTIFTTRAIGEYVAPVDVTALDVTSNSADITWTSVDNDDTWNVRYRLKAEGYLYDFEDEAQLDDWVIVDNDGDGFNWEYFDSTINAHSGDGVLSSASYDNDTYSPLTPDNWLILTKEIELGGSVSFWAVGQDASWAEEHFAVFLSTTGTNIEDFTEQVLPETVASDEYEQFVIDLSAYKGKKGYIAIRHYNCTDMFRLNIDDVEILEGEPEPWTVVENVTENPFTIDGLEPGEVYEVQVQGVHEDGISDWSESGVFTTLKTVYLADNEDNSVLIDKYKGETADVQIVGRTFVTNDTWNTLCLPFDVSLDNPVFEGAVVKELNSAESFYTAATSTLTLNFDDVEGKLLAGKPYIVKWNSQENIIDPIFTNVVIKDVAPIGVTTSEGKATFIGSYSPVVLPADNKALYFGAANTLYYPTVDFWVGAFRATFRLENVTAEDPESGVRAFVLNFNGDETTGIRTIGNAEKGLVNGDDAWYTVDGIRLNSQPTVKGVYVHGGKKVVLQ